MTLYRIDPKTRRIIVSDLTPSIRIPLSSLPYYMDELNTSSQEQSELLLNLASINEKLELLLGGTPVVKFKDKDNDIHTLDEILLMDAMSTSPVSITFPHHKIHNGDSFTTNFTDETLADAETIILAFKTATGTKRVHLFAFFSTLVGGSLNIWEGATWTTNTGVVNPIINRRRDENPKPSGIREDLTTTPAFTATGNILSNPTLTGGVVTPTGATSIDKQYAWGERGKIGAGYLRDENEFPLKPDTTYAIIFTAIGSSNKAQINMNWYESEDKT